MITSIRNQLESYSALKNKLSHRKSILSHTTASVSKPSKQEAPNSPQESAILQSHVDSHFIIDHLYTTIQFIEDENTTKTDNLIFICVFGVNYIELLFYLLESLYLFSDITNSTDILIYTDTECQDLIKQSPYYTNRILFEVNDSLITTREKCAARLDFFNFAASKIYKKVLYLDADIIVKDSIKDIFSSLIKDKLYAVEEGTFDSLTDFWGRSLFDMPTNKPAFSSGVLLFLTSKTIKDLFEETKTLMRTNIIPFATQEQPYIVYIFTTRGCYDNQILKKFVYLNNNTTVSKFEDNSESIKTPILHFCGYPGVTSHKRENMKYYLTTLKKNILTSIDIQADVWTISEKFRYDIMHFFENKHKNTIIEIGSYKGYTTRILSKIFNKVIAVDNNPYHHYENMKINNDRNNIRYDVFDLYKDRWTHITDDVQVAFIDAGHSYAQCKSDICNILNTFKTLQYIIFDDYGVWTGVKQAVDEYISSNKLKFKTFAGLFEHVPGPNNTICNSVHEGIIVEVVKNDIVVVPSPTKDNLIGLTISVNYSDYLELTLADNTKKLNTIFVVTDPADIKTINCCKKYENVTVLKYDNAFKNGAKFDKSTLLRRAQKHLHEIYPNFWIVYIDADTVIPDILYDCLKTEKNITESTIFLTNRKIYKTKESFLKRQNGEIDIFTQLCKGAGFFQCYFNKRIFYPFEYSISNGKRSAEGCDIYFQELFYDKRFLDIYSDHIGECVINWEGRVSEYVD